MFQTYERPRRYVKRELEPYASINPRLEIFLNHAVYEKLNGLNYPQVWYDPETRLIEIRTGEPGVYHYRFTMRRCGRGKRSRILRAGRLLRPLGLSLDRTHVFRSLEFKPGPTVVLDLSTAQELNAQRALPFDLRKSWAFPIMP